MMMMMTMATQLLERPSVLIYQLGMCSVTINSFQEIHKRWHYHQWNRFTQTHRKNGISLWIPNRIQIKKKWVYHFQNPFQWQVSISILDLLTVVLLLLLLFFPVIFLWNSTLVHCHWQYFNKKEKLMLFSKQ